MSYHNGSVVRETFSQKKLTRTLVEETNDRVLSDLGRSTMTRLKTRVTVDGDDDFRPPDSKRRKDVTRVIVTKTSIFYAFIIVVLKTNTVPVTLTCDVSYK